MTGMNGDEGENMRELTAQIEYYLSEKNLEQDTFFNKQLKESDDNSIEIETILKCNNVIRLGATTEDIIKCAESS